MKNSLNSKKVTTLNILELFVLLLIPLPFLDLNVLYVILVLIITLSSKYLRKEKWADFGFKKINLKMAAIAATIGILFGLADNYILEKLLEKWIERPDLSQFEFVEGNIGALIGLLALGWVIGGLFEEYFFRGYLFHRLNSIITNPVMHKWFSIIVTSVVFAFAHSYQGIGGIVATFYFSVILGLLYFYFGKNIWYLILVHGFFDTVGVFRLYFGH